ncbi:MAG: PIG-L family deacetylase [Cellvibrionaceae bacterium]|nr:PIG-L family deacetylase [Cellvibrionaceae bacterium]
MLQPKILSNLDKPLHILCIGAHCDDIEIGCGGSMLHLLDNNPDIHVTWLVLTSNKVRKSEAIAGAELFLEKARRKDIRILDMRDGYLPYLGASVKDTFEEIKKTIDTPEVIFTHYRHDLHQDHRLVSELTWNTFRNHLIFEYEIPKWDGDLAVPNSFVSLKESIAKKKIAYLQQAYNTQNNKQWFTDDLFWSVMRIRGMECASPSRLAEAFYSRKIMFDLSLGTK